VPKSVNANAYHIVDMQGRVVNSGTLHTGKNNVSLDNAVPGNYLVYAPNSVPVKIVKE